MLADHSVTLAALYGGDLRAWSEAIGSLLGRPVEVTAVRQTSDAIKQHGMTDSVELTVVEPTHGVVRAFLKRPWEGLYGESLVCDSAREAVWRLEGYPRYPGHVGCAAVGSLVAGRLEPSPVGTDPIVVLEWALPSVVYAERLAELRRPDQEARAAADARDLCRAMIAAHRVVPGDQQALYRRSVRDTLVNASYRLIDSAPGFWSARSALRARVEHALAEWRILLGDQQHRLRAVHHDFHPWNVSLDERTGMVSTIGARLPGWGDPFDDLAAFLVNYLMFGHLAHGGVEGAYLAGFERYRETYLEETGDERESGLFAPFLAKRLLVLLNPVYYPSTPAATSRWLELLLGRCVDGKLDLLRCDPGDLADAAARGERGGWP